MIFWLLLTLLIVLPLVELALLIYLAQLTSLWFTMGVVIATGVLGAALARWQGWQTWRQIHDELAAGRLPAEALLDAMMILAAGLLLLTPGMITDLVGFSLLIPPCRRQYRRWAIDWIRRRLRFVGPLENGGPCTGPHGDRIVDYQVIDADDGDAGGCG